MEEDTPRRLDFEPLKDFWIQQGEDYHLFQCSDMLAQPSNTVKCDLQNPSLEDIACLSFGLHVAVKQLGCT